MFAGFRAKQDELPEIELVHILLGIIEADGVGAQALKSAGVSLSDAEQVVAGSTGEEQARSRRRRRYEPPFAAEAKDALEGALALAPAPPSIIDSGHLLLGALAGLARTPLAPRIADQERLAGLVQRYRQEQAEPSQ